MGVDFKKLQNGSDIRGVALEGVKGEAVNLTRDAGWWLMKGFADYLARTTGKKRRICWFLSAMTADFRRNP